MEVIQYFAILRKWYRLILFTTVLAGVTAFAVGLVLPPTFEAEAAIALVRSGTQVNFDPKIKTVSEADLTQPTLDLTARRRALTTLAKSPEIGTTVIAKIGPQLDTSERLAADLLNSIDAGSDGDLIRIKAKSGSAEKAALIANAWAQEYSRQANSLFGDTSLSAAELQAQADAAKRDYDRQEATLVAYLGTNQIDQLKRQIEQKQKKLDDWVALEGKIDRLLSDARSLRDQLSSEGLGASQGSELAAMLLEASAFSTWSNLPVDLQLPLDRVTTGATRDEQLRNLEALIARLEDRHRAILAEPLTQVQQEVSQLQAQLEQEEAKREELGAARDLARSTYTTLANKVAEANVAAQLQGMVVRLAVPAIAPQEPVRPNKLLYTLFGCVLGFILGVGLALVLNAMDDSIGDQDQVSSLLQLPTIGEIPELEKSSFRGQAAAHGSPMGVLQDAPYGAVESFRLLQYMLLSNHPSCKVLLVTSALPGEGKSLIVANLAARIAEAGKKVTCIDGDLRHPSQHQYFGLQNVKGLGDLLAEATLDWEVTFQRTRVEGLHLITAGSLTSDPTLLLQSPNLERLLQELKGVSDLVIIDAPATLGLADIPILARSADLIAMVVASNRVSRRDLMRAKEVLLSTRVPLAGVILNRSRKLAGEATYDHYGNLGRASEPGVRDRHTPSWNLVYNVTVPELRARVASLFGARRSE